MDGHGSNNDGGRGRGGGIVEGKYWEGKLFGIVSYGLTMMLVMVMVMVMVISTMIVYAMLLALCLWTKFKSDSPISHVAASFSDTWS